jgi:hypothetical protein
MFRNPSETSCQAASKKSIDIIQKEVNCGDCKMIINHLLDRKENDFTRERFSRRSRSIEHPSAKEFSTLSNLSPKVNQHPLLQKCQSVPIFGNQCSLLTQDVLERLEKKVCN